MEYISQVIWYSRACGSYQDFLDRGLLLTRKISWLIVHSGWDEIITSKVLPMNCVTVTEFVGSNHNPVLFPFMTYYMWCSNSVPFRDIWLTPVLLGFSCPICSIVCVVFCRSLFVILFFFFWLWCCLSFDLRLLNTLRYLKVWCHRTWLRLAIHCHKMKHS